MIEEWEISVSDTSDNMNVGQQLQGFDCVFRFKGEMFGEEKSIEAHASSQGQLSANTAEIGKLLASHGKVCREMALTNTYYVSKVTGQ